jgi:dTDP-4-amino-4,6-dideoxygalactose transaminase
MIPLHKPFVPSWDVLGSALRRVYESGQISQGAEVEEFERRFGDFVGNRNVVAVSSCTAALHLALELAGARGGEVVSTPMTAEPTNLAIHHAGAQVRWADIDPLTGNVTRETVEEAMQSCQHLRAVMVVHYGGIPVDKTIGELGQLYNVPIVEDCAHALGASPIGWGDYQCYSFQAIKHITTGGEGGALVIPDANDETMCRARNLRWFGIDRAAPRTSVGIKETGWKYNLTNVQAAIGLEALKDVPHIISLYRGNGFFFEHRLRGIPGLSRTHFWESADGLQPTYLFFTILVERRDDLARKLRERGVECGQIHRRNDEHPVFAYAKRELPGLNSYYSKMLHIPSGWWVGAEDRQYIVDVIRGGW